MREPGGDSGPGAEAEGRASLPESLPIVYQIPGAKLTFAWGD